VQTELGLYTVRNIQSAVHRDHFLKPGQLTISECFGVTKFEDGDRIRAFLEVSIGILNWAERNHLEKDWLLRYAFQLIRTFSETPNLPTHQVQIPLLQAHSLIGYPFQFNFEGWDAGEETKESFEARMQDAFRNETERYFHDIAVELELDKAKRKTNTGKPKRVKWLVQSVLLDWDKSKIIEEHAVETERQTGRAQYVDESTIDSAFRQFRELDLPNPISVPKLRIFSQKCKRYRLQHGNLEY
jgi:hypothetical protein